MSFRSGQHGRADCLALFRARLCALHKRTATTTQAGLGSQTVRSGTDSFKTLRWVIEVVQIFASVNAITQSFLSGRTQHARNFNPLS